ncbi:MAG: A/G-specific adenine glycosylase [Gammaproteobacteria bacterium]|nr:A/G-specific adenine glycosylase [Gammaproteobacteria bacterium]
MTQAPDFAQRVLAWFARHGRKTLPWQQEPTPYRVWISEIMLQQTQVATVIPYYQRFMARFPSLADLAEAPEDEVLALWSGLGYYSRARNLHAAAKRVMHEHGGKFPAELDEIAELPGIGPSTAGAIRSLGHQLRGVILDGNVKRVLARHGAVAGWPGETAVLKRLWELAEAYTPERDFGPYTQAMMDLGALICTRNQPRCDDCPVAADCAARLADAQGRYPGRKPAKPVPEREVQMLIIQDSQGAVLLQKRPPTGIWGGLWSLPECPAGSDGVAWAEDELGLKTRERGTLPAFSHTFSHFRLLITPQRLSLSGASALAEGEWRFYARQELAAIGLPAPIAKLLDSPGPAA